MSGWRYHAKIKMADQKRIKNALEDLKQFRKRAAQLEFEVLPCPANYDDPFAALTKQICEYLERWPQTHPKIEKIQVDLTVSS